MFYPNTLKNRSLDAVFHGASNGNLCQVSQTIIKLKEAKTSLKSGAFVLHINKLEFFENFLSKKDFKNFLIVIFL